MAEAASRRVFFALWPDASACDALDELASQCTAQCGGTRIARVSLHLTLAFIGPASPERIEALLDAASKVRAVPFEMTLDRLGCWARNRILWAGCNEVPPLEQRLFSALALELAGAGFPLEARPHAPHVTLVRNARCDRLKRRDIAVPWRSEAFSLVESSLQPSGARYDVLASWPLREG